MDLEDVRTRLDAALPIRVPRRDPNQRVSILVSALNDYLLDTAYHRGELEEALRWCLEAQKSLRCQWEDIRGAEAMVPKAQRTEKTLAAAKREIQPGTWEAMQEAKALAEALGRQIRRLELDATAVSRSYTLLTGGA